jgi:hypothetical protein
MTAQLKMRFKVGIVLLSIFALGSVAGAALDGVYRTAGGAPPSIRDGEAYLRVLDSQLHLNSDQRSTMRVILNQTRDEYSTLCSQVRPRYNDVRDRARQRLRDLLLPEQQKEFDQIVSQESCNCPDQTPR